MTVPSEGEVVGVGVPVEGPGVVHPANRAIHSSIPTSTLKVDNFMMFIVTGNLINSPI
ncbi:MAG: hypothetical protein A4E42_01978 [Methanoregulaceae archaeon PtaU1.Bin222]|jgi:hypothetical protein|nr:MAG: hypothetical protein A4E42_01978 [Methanoregulaceae archaeon PtaU1.Bin222]